MTNHLQLVAIATALTTLTACGGGDEGSIAAVEDTATAADEWDATDACALLDKAAVGAALGDPVTETSLAFVNEASGPNAATSECTYRLASGGTAMLMARRSPIADNTDAAIATARKGTEQTLAAFGDTTVEDITGLGKAAFYVPKINQLTVFLDDDKSIILTLGSAPKDTAKKVAVDLVGKIGI